MGNPSRYGRTSLAALLGAAAMLHSFAPGSLAQDQVAELHVQGAGGLYEGHRAVRVSVTSPRELMTVLALTDDVLTCTGAGIGTFDVRFTPEEYDVFSETDIAHEVLIENLQAHLDAWWSENEAIRQQDGGWYEAFRDLGELNVRMDALAAAHADIATISVIGQSLEGRPIRIMRITGTGTATPLNERPALVINGTQHARESLSPMVTLFFIEHLLTNYATDPRIERLLDGVEFHITPMINPDGYYHCWTGTWMWRKNRRENAGSNCMGVDLNRNWAEGFGMGGSSGDPCNQTYRGSAAFSEPETQALRTVVDGLGAQGRMSLHVDIHSHGAMFLSPWGYTTQPAPGLHGMNYIGQFVKEAIASHRETQYTYGPASIVLYTAAGVAPDYAFAKYGALGWTIELPGAGFGFYPPADHILPVSNETTLGLLALGEFFLAPSVEGACCIPASIGGAGDCIITGEAQCEAAAGFYFGDGTDCESAGGGACPSALVATGEPNGAMTTVGCGIFLDLTATGRDLDVERFDFPMNTAIGTPVSVQVWTYAGSYVGNDGSSAGWVLHDTVGGFSNGLVIPTRFDLSVPLSISSEETVGVYLVVPSGGIRYTRLNTQPSWANDDLKLFSDRARSEPWGGTAFTPRTYSGSVHYSMGSVCYANCDGSTNEPILNVDDFTCFISEFSAGCP